MRFMMLMYPDEGEKPRTAAAREAVGAYNDELKRAGVLLELGGLHPPSEGARVSFAGDGPLVARCEESRGSLGGYWMIEVDSEREAIAWATCAPAAPGVEVEVRRVYEPGDFAVAS
jgi:hypothetical protein